MGKALRDFTVAELDALPVGARFVDRGSFPGVSGADRELLIVEWTLTKREDGSWSFPNNLPSKSSAMMINEWADDPYFLESSSSPTESPTPSDIREALAPFSRVVRELTDAAPDDFALIEIRGVWFTAGDFRRIVRALEGM